MAHENQIWASCKVLVVPLVAPPFDKRLIASWLGGCFAHMRQIHPLVAFLFVLESLEGGNVEAKGSSKPRQRGLSFFSKKSGLGLKDPAKELWPLHQPVEASEDNRTGCVFAPINCNRLFSASRQYSIWDYVENQDGNSAFEESMWAALGEPRDPG